MSQLTIADLNFYEIENLDSQTIEGGKLVDVSNSVGVAVNVKPKVDVDVKNQKIDVFTPAQVAYGVASAVAIGGRATSSVDVGNTLVS
ncbi:MAG: hypothetical protein ACRC2R_13010 [Xenococcaceae cyanobacterium]